jgi:hypothetical protein
MHIAQRLQAWQNARTYYAQGTSTLAAPSAAAHAHIQLSGWIQFTN